MKTNPSQQQGAARGLRVLALVAAALGCWGIDTRAEEESSIEETFRDALYAEEVKGDVEAALKVYQDVGKRFDHQRNLAATALFREGECLRKLKRDTEAAEAYEKVLALYGDVERVALQAREGLLALGKSAPEPAEGSSAIAIDQEATEILRLKKLVAESPDLLNASTDDQPPPLHEAVSKGQRRVAAFLLDSGAKVDLVWKEETPLPTAARTGHKAMCVLLLERGANGEEDKAKALVIALKNGREAVARLLLDHKADPNGATVAWDPDVNSSCEATALLLAVKTGIAPELVIRLLKAGADPTVKVTVQRYSTQDGRRFRMTGDYGSYVISPIDEAITRRSLEIVEALLAQGANPNPAPGDTSSPLTTAIRSIPTKNTTPESTDDPIVNALLSAGADWKASSALSTAAARGFVGWMEKAFEAGCDVNAVDEYGQTVLFRACSAAQPDAIRLLLEHGAKPNVRDGEGRPILQPSWITNGASDKIPEKGFECLRLLLKGGADPDALFGNDTALSQVTRDWYGSQAFTPGFVDLLLEHGANPRLGETLSNERFQSQGSNQDPARRQSFLKVWQAAHFDAKNNPKRDQAVWLSQGISRFDAFGTPLCMPVFGRAGASGPGTLRQFAQALNVDIPLNATAQGTLPVTITSLSGEAREALDLIAHLKSDEDIALQWGDIVEVTYATGNPITDVLDPEAEIDIRLDLGNGNFFANAENASGPVMRIKARENLSLNEVLWEAGVVPYFVAGTSLMRATEEGLVPSSGRIRHGDVIQVTVAEAKPLSESALREGFHICQSLEGPFWNIGKDWEPFSIDWRGKFSTLTRINLLLAAVSPSGLPLNPIDWNAARARSWQGFNWQDVPLLEAIEHFSGSSDAISNLTLVLPPSESGTRTLPEEIRGKLTEKASFDWHLGVLDEPLVKHRYVPPFFRIEEVEGGKVWRDIDDAHAPRPVTADIGQLLMVDPRYPQFGAAEVDSSTNGILVKAFQTSGAQQGIQAQQQAAQQQAAQQQAEQIARAIQQSAQQQAAQQRASEKLIEDLKPAAQPPAAPPIPQTPSRRPVLPPSGNQ